MQIDRDIHVIGQDSDERVNAATAIVTELTAPDGRRFMIREWHPSVRMDHPVSVKINAIVAMPKPAEQERISHHLTAPKHDCQNQQ